MDLTDLKPIKNPKQPQMRLLIMIVSYLYSRRSSDAQNWVPIYKRILLHLTHINSTRYSIIFPHNTFLSTDITHKFFILRNFNFIKSFTWFYQKCVGNKLTVTNLFNFFGTAIFKTMNCKVVVNCFADIIIPKYSFSTFRRSH